MYNATVRLSYINDTDSSSSKYFPELVDKHTITIEAPAQDLNVHQHFELFKAFLRAMDFNEYSIMDGACRLAFNDSNDEAQMKKLMEEYELQDKQAYDDDDCRAMEAEIRDLKAKLSRALNPDADQYLPEEMDAMDAEAQQGNKKELLNKLENADVVCFDCGSKYGEYHDRVSSVWEGKCNVCGEVKKITESRDFKYLVKVSKNLLNNNIC
jgi:hypothetical protein